MLVGTFIHDGDLVDRDIRDLFVLITQIKNARFNVDDIAAKRRVSATRHVYFFTQEML